MTLQELEQQCQELHEKLKAAKRKTDKARHYAEQMWLVESSIGQKWKATRAAIAQLKREAL